MNVVDVDSTHPHTHRGAARLERELSTLIRPLTGLDDLLGDAHLDADGELAAGAAARKRREREREGESSAGDQQNRTRCDHCCLITLPFPPPNEATARQPTAQDGISNGVELRRAPSYSEIRGSGVAARAQSFGV